MALKTDRKKFMIWLFTFAVVAIVMFFYFHAPVLPIALGGALAFFLTFRSNSSKK